MRVKIFSSDDGSETLQFQNDIGCWMAAEQPDICFVLQSESMTLAEDGKVFLHRTITIFYSGKENAS